ncbi:sugar transferase [Priestia flexa]|uniref:sugar transferase n=1 Tax=Priestia flexa TaxID=86664 RepID=UPI001B326694|nr:sugar transferase [Priestia flexa]
MKRLFDVFVAFILLIILSPLILLLALLVRMKLGSPVIFKQERAGQHGERFILYKFRSMTDEKDIQGKLLPNEKRLTTLGMLLRKTSLDELPQLLNVLKGDISLVGPRPLLVEYLELYNSEQAKRNLVKPGITGWAQVNGRNSISWEDKFKLDVWYVENKSFRLDLKILFLTVLKVVKREDINPAGQVSVERFKGQSKSS